MFRFIDGLSLIVKSLSVLSGTSYSRDILQ